MSKKDHSKEHVNKETGEITPQGKLNEVIIHRSVRKNKSRRIQHDYVNCPSMAEQHTAHLTNVNYLMEKYKPDELAHYIAARQAYRQEIVGHDFSEEPNLQDSMNVVYKSRQLFEELDPDLKRNFKSHVEFLKFIDNPANAERMIKLGILTKKNIQELQDLTPTIEPAETRPSKTTKHEEAAKP